MAQQRDRWEQWLLERRHGGEAALLEEMLPRLYEVRDRVLANAAIVEGDVVLDVGAGNGLLGFGALEMVGPRGQVIFSDISVDLLNECRRLAKSWAKPSGASSSARQRMISFSTRGQLAS